MQIDRPIAIALILFVVVLLVFFLVMPEYKTFQSLQTELAEKKAEFNAEFDYYAAITKTYYDLQNHQDDINKIDNALPTDPDLGKIVYFLQRAADQNSMIVKDLFLSKSTANSQPGSQNIKDITFSMDLLGDYTSLEQFIMTLEKSARVFEVTSISFGSAADALSVPGQSQFQTQQTYSFNLQITTHSY